MFADDSIMAIPLKDIPEAEKTFNDFCEEYGPQINTKKTEIGIPCKKFHLNWKIKIFETEITCLERWRFLGFQLEMKVDSVIGATNKL